MLNEKNSRLREELNNSIINGQDYSVTYELSVQLDKLIAEYYKIELDRRENKPKSKVIRNRKIVLKA